MMYTPLHCDVNGSNAIGKLSGSSLARKRRTYQERAFLGADLHLARVDLTRPTLRQVSRLVGVPRSAIAEAIAIIDDPDLRAAVLSGRLPLHSAKRNSESLAEHLARSTPDEMIGAARAVGIDVIWDGMISPLL